MRAVTKITIGYTATSSTFHPALATWRLLAVLRNCASVLEGEIIQGVVSELDVRRKV